MNKLFFLILSFATCLLLCSDAFSQSKEEVISHHNKATGLSEIRDIKTICITGERESSSYGKTSVNGFWTGIKEPELIYTEIDYTDYKLVYGYDGKRFWTNTGFIPHERSMDVIISRVKANLESLNSYLGKDQIKSLSIAVIHDTEYIRLLVETEDEYTVIFFLDPSDYLVKIIHFHLSDPATGDVYVNERRYSDFRNIHGIFIPFTEESYYHGTLSWTERISNVELNCKIDDKVFYRPEN
ncbi:MAG: hypothetical protein ACFCUM_18965 [Bacteroidales bacterium]